MMFSVIIGYWSRFAFSKFANRQSRKLGFLRDQSVFVAILILECSVLKGNVLMAVLSNYMVDMDWLLSGACLLIKTLLSDCLYFISQCKLYECLIPVFRLSN